MAQIKYEELKSLLDKKTSIVGCDEVGYGSIAGPLVVCGVRAPKGWTLAGLNDSKKLTENRRNVMRDQLMKLIEAGTIKFHLAERTNAEIDKVGVGVALKDCYVENFKALYTDESLLICDGNLKFDNLGVDDYDKVSLVKADTLVPSVMAASILAKTYRDKKMREYHLKYPQYDWINNVGYYGADGQHIAGIAKHGYSPLHRLSYKLKVFEGMKIPVNE